MNKAKLIVTRVFDSERTPQDAFVRAILNSDKYEKNLHVSSSESIIKHRGLIYVQPDSDEEGRNRWAGQHTEVHQRQGYIPVYRLTMGTLTVRAIP